MKAHWQSIDYLDLLAKQYPSIQAASTALVGLTAQLQLPKGTEHFLSDVHGEHEAFQHALKTGSGSIRRKIEQRFGDTLTEQEKRSLATLIYYPEQKLPLILKTVDDETEWLRLTLDRLLSLVREVAGKYSRSQFRSALPSPFAGLIEELLQEQDRSDDKGGYCRSLIETIITSGTAGEFITTLAELIQRLAVAKLHVIGDIYDRGPGAHLIMDSLMEYHDVDIQWGNHDIVWMGAAAGSEACMANVIRICLRYANMETLENGYAISLLPLASFAMDIYGDDPCESFLPKLAPDHDLTEHERKLMARMHKAITIMQLKLEGQVVLRRPEFQMRHRLLLDKISHEEGVIHLDGAIYPLLDTHFPTLDPARPHALTDRERIVIEKLKLSFAQSRRLQRHVRFLFAKGAMYLVHNGNLLYHGCIAMNQDGSFKGFEVGGNTYAGKALVDGFDRLARQGYFATDASEDKQRGLDAMLYLWSGEHSPLYGKEKMATFERYFIADQSTHAEKRNPYYGFRDQAETAGRILAEFGLDPETGCIVNGHVPVRVRKGESPVKADGRLIVIDGGFSRAYQSHTGIAGYTLVYNSHGKMLVAHEPFVSVQKAIEEELDSDLKIEILTTSPVRERVRDADLGRKIQQRIDELEALLAAYRAGRIKEGLGEGWRT
jgi:fructose-1,6-bisphosphatase-3